MGWNDHIDDDGFADFLQELLDCDALDEIAAGITRLVIDKGTDVLTEKQRHVFEKHVIKEFVTEECIRCGNHVPWSEMYEAYDNGGHCSWCAKMMSNDD